MTSNRQLLLGLSKLMRDQRRPVEAAWIGFRARLLDGGTPQEIVDFARLHFFAATMHLFQHIVDIEQSAGCEDEFAAQMELVADELGEFKTELSAETLITKGNA